MRSRYIFIYKVTERSWLIYGLLVSFQVYMSAMNPTIGQVSLPPEAADSTLSIRVSKQSGV